MCNGASLKAITRRLVGRVGGVKNAARICGVTDSEVSFWQNDAHDRYIPIDHLVLLDTAAGDIFLNELAQSRGYNLIPFSAASEPHCQLIPNIIGLLARESGELHYTALDAASDGIVTPAEARRIRDVIAPVKDKIAALEQAIS